MMHIAAALKKQVIAIWGSTVPALGMWPYYGEQHLVRQPDMYDHIQVKGLWCRPCTTIGRTECPLGHFKCMKKMDMGEVAGRVEERLRGKR
jgi:heptosyltransferase-2